MLTSQSTPCNPKTSSDLTCQTSMLAPLTTSATMTPARLKRGRQWNRACAREGASAAARFDGTAGRSGRSRSAPQATAARPAAAAKSTSPWTREAS